MAVTDGQRDNPTIVVDLDRTLARTDILHEGMLTLLAANPLILLRLLGWLLGGRARLKAEVAASAKIDPQLLPYNATVLQFLREQKAQGHSIILATAANRRPAEAVAKHLGLFDDVIASDRPPNLKGEAKLQAIREKLNDHPFVYVGDSFSDLPVFRAAAAAILVDPSPRLRRRAEAVGNVARVISEPTSSWIAFIQALRPHQWVKNLLVFLPTLTSWGLYPVERLSGAVVAFLALSCLSAAVYLVNDLLDLSSDRAHPVKRLRPFASGSLPLWTGVVGSMLLVLLGALLGSRLPGPATSLLAFYGVMAFMYSLWLKRVLLLDVFVLGALYASRIVLGAESIRVGYSLWFVLFFSLASLHLALLKRHVEILADTDRAAEPSARRGYEVDDARFLAMFGIGSSVAAAVVLALYVTSPDVNAVYKAPNALLLLCPAYLIHAFYMWLMAARGRVDHDPVSFISRDRYSYVVAVVSLAILLLARRGL